MKLQQVMRSQQALQEKHSQHLKRVEYLIKAAELQPG
jgi:hypothetical protein